MNLAIFKIMHEYSTFPFLCRNLADVVTSAADIVLESLIEIDEDQKHSMQRPKTPFHLYRSTHANEAILI